MTRTIQVELGEDPRTVGVLRHDVQGSRENASFEYSADWLAGDDRFAIDPALPLVRGPQFHRRERDGSLFHSVIADAEPDGWARRVILRDHAKRRDHARRAGGAIDTRPLNELDFLLAVDDFSRLGALRFRDEEGVFQGAREEGGRAAPPLIELEHLLAATLAVETNTETDADLAYLRGRGTSLAGLRPKCSVVDDDGSLSIAKFPSVQDERPVTKGEVLAMRLAAMSGINVADARLIDSAGTPVALVRRFDRAEGGSRLMYASAPTLLGAERRGSHEHAYTEIVDVIRVHGSDVQSDIDELWRRIAFSILITNVDDHLLNHGFLHVDNEQWRLSPAFDLNPFPEKLRELKTWISEDTGPEATIDALMSVIAYFRLSTDKAKAILAEVEAGVSRWRDSGKRIGMTTPELDQFADAFEHPEREAARRAMK